MAPRLNRRDAKRVTAVRQLARAKEREANARLNRAHEVALKLVRKNDVIALESLNLRAMTKSAKGTVGRMPPEDAHNEEARTFLIPRVLRPPLERGLSKPFGC